MWRSLSQVDPFQNPYRGVTALSHVKQSPDQVTPRVTAEGVSGQQRRIHQHDHRADADAEAALTEERGEAFPPQEDEQCQRAVQRVAVQILNEEQPLLSAVAEWHPS